MAFWLFCMNTAWNRIRSSRMAKNVFALYVLQLAYTVLPLLTVPYLIQKLTPEGFGLSAATQSFAGYFNVVLEYGFYFSAVREVAAVKNDRVLLSKTVASIFWTKTVLTVACTCVFAAFIGFAPNFQINRFEYVIAYLTIVTSSFLPIWLYQGLELVSETSYWSLAARFGQLPFMFWLVRSKSDVWIWLLISLGTALVLTVTFWFRAIPRLVSFPKWPGWNDILKQLQLGFTIFFSSAATSLYTVGNTFVLSQLIGIKSAGYYAAVEKIVRALFGLLIPVQQVLFPRISDLVQKNQGKAVRVARLATGVNSLLGVFLGFGLAIFASPIQETLLGKEYKAAVPLLQIMATLPFLFAAGSSLTYQLLIPFHLDRGLVIVYLFAGIVNILLAFILVPRISFFGMAASVIIAESIVVIGQIWVLRHVGINLFRASLKRDLLLPVK